MAPVLGEALQADYMALDTRVNRLRSAIGSQSIETALAALWDEPGELVTAPAPSIGAARLRLSEGVGAAVENLDRAVRQAVGLLRGAGASNDGVIDRHFAALSRAGARGHSHAGAMTELDTGAVQASAALVAAALDRALPTLRTTGPVGRAGISVDGCDIHEDLPHLCIGSDADNTYTADVALLIDLGGNDVYKNSAGGAPIVAPNGDSIPVSVSVDLAGNDTYEGFARDASESGTGGPASFWVGQGAAVGSALGLLVDIAGDDEYTASTPPTTPERPNAYTTAQGGALVGGVGGLFDLAGDDRYVAKAPQVVSAGNMFVQGGAENSAAALLVDSGVGDDTYEADGGTVVLASGSGPVPSYEVSAQASASTLATAVLYDDGGRDVFEARASARNERTGEAGIPSASVSSQGLGFVGGAAYLLEGEGPTTYRIDSSGSGIARAISRGQGGAYGLFGPDTEAVLDDRGGDDSYRLVMQQTLEREIEVADPCTCKFAEGGVDPDSHGILVGQGASFLGGDGLLRDLGGDDSYLAGADQRVSVTLDDRLQSPSRPPYLSVTGFDSPLVVAQGAANGGTGVLLEASGTDSYQLRLTNEATASATSEYSGGPPTVTSLASGPMGNGQGAGGGAGFIDLAGSGDRIESSAKGYASTAPDPDGAFLSAGIWPRVHGAGGGAQFVVLGEGPVIRSEPSRPACSVTASGARRGFGTWTECPVVISEEDPEHQSFDDPAVGAPSSGYAPGSTGAAPSLTITPDTPSQAPVDYAETLTPDTVILPVGARLLGPDGLPLVGRRIHFTLQIDQVMFFWPLDQVMFWPIVWQVDATTDDSGIARGRLPLLRTGLVPGGPWRVVASFDGEAELYPRFVAHPLTLTSAS